MAELQSLSITATSGRISCICCSRGSHMEIWRIMSSGFVSGSLVFVVLGVASRERKIGSSWLDSAYMLCINTDAFGEFHIFFLRQSELES